MLIRQVSLFDRLAAQDARSATDCHQDRPVHEYRVRDMIRVLAKALVLKK